MFIFRTLFLLILVMGYTAFTEEAPLMASPAGNGSSEEIAVAPEGFDLRKLEKTDSLANLCRQDLA